MAVSIFNRSFWAGAVALSVAASAASASTVSLTYHGATSGGDRETARIMNAPVSPGSGSWPKTVGAWGFNMKDSSGVLGDFVAWCLDVGSYLSTSSTDGKSYDITNDPFSNSYGMTIDQQARVESVFNANYGTVDIAKGKEAAGFQLALWNALYDDDLDVTAGVFRADASTFIEDLANGYLDAGDSYNGALQFRFTYLQSSGQSKYQNLVTVTPVPLPGAAGMLVLALGGMGLMARRSKAA